MLDAKTLREQSGAVKDSTTKRGKDAAIVDKWLAADKEWRELKKSADEMRSRRNKLSEEINKGIKAGKDTSSLQKEAKEVPDKIKKAEERLLELEKELRETSLAIPNIFHESVPIGKDEHDNRVEETFGKKPEFKFEPLSHVDLMEKQGWADLERAAKLSGARWYFLQGDLARLELALISYAVSILVEKGFKLTIPPYMLGDKAYESVCDISTFRTELYRDPQEKLSLIATSEHPLTSMHMDEVLNAAELPVKLCGFSACFRKEAGSHGKDQKGIFRVHQFHKVEQIVFAHPKQSWAILEEMRQNMKGFFESLGLHGRIITLCSGDMGHVAAKTYDAECWYPVQNTYRETGSCSNCTIYQAVGLNMRYQEAEERGWLYTLNSTMCATTRALVAIIENFQNADGTVNIPKVLQPYMNKQKKMGKKIR